MNITSGFTDEYYNMIQVGDLNYERIKFSAEQSMKNHNSIIDLHERLNLLQKELHNRTILLGTAIVCLSLANICSRFF